MRVPYRCSRPRPPRPWRGVVLAGALALGLCGPAQAGRIEGTIRFADLEGTRSTLSPYAGRLGSEGQPSAPPPPSVQEIALYLVDLRPPDPTPPTAPPPQLKQISIRFEPRVLAVPVGTTVDFPNLDPVFHNVFSYSPARRFDLGRYGQGKSRSVTFDRPGLVKVFCDVHAGMSAYVLVVDTPYVVQPDATGLFAIDGVPEGRHRMTIWHPDRGEQTIEVDVGPGTTNVDIGF